MKKSRMLVFALIFFFAAISLALIIYNLYFSSNTFSLMMYYETSEKMGVNTDTGALYFGKSSPGSLVTREVNLTNSNTYPVYVTIKLLGNISGFVSVSDNNFILLPDEKKHITYYLQAPEGTPFANFTGETRIFTRRILSG